MSWRSGAGLLSWAVTSPSNALPGHPAAPSVGVGGGTGGTGVPRSRPHPGALITARSCLACTRKLRFPGLPPFTESLRERPACPPRAVLGPVVTPGLLSCLHESLPFPGFCLNPPLCLDGGWREFNLSHACDRSCGSFGLPAPSVDVPRSSSNRLLGGQRSPLGRRPLEPRQMLTVLLVL